MREYRKCPECGKQFIINAKYTEWICPVCFSKNQFKTVFYGLLTGFIAIIILIALNYLFSK